MSSSIYFDHAAATPLDSRVARAMEPYWSKEYYNPSSLYTAARRTKAALRGARMEVANELGAKLTEIIFTAGATEANNLAILGTIGANVANHVVSSNIEHESILEVMNYLNSNGSRGSLAPVNFSGIINLNKLESAITDQTLVVSVMYANNEIGTVQPLTKVASLIEQIRRDRQRRKIQRPLYFHTDATQAVNYLDLKVSRLKVDLMTLNGSKIYGPKQSGCLYVRSGTVIDPIIHGGRQEYGLRSGTENVPASIGFARAVAIASSQRKSESARLTKLRDDFINQLLNQIDGVELNGDAKKRLPNNINLTFKDVSGENLVHSLDAKGIQVATGSACSANNDESSYVLQAIGLSETKVNSSLRITLGRSTTRADLTYLLKTLKATVTKLRQIAAK